MAILTDKDPIIVLSLNDVIHVVDVSDVTSTPQGTSKKMTLTQLKSIVHDAETDPIFTASPANSVIDSGGGTLFLADDGTYKSASAAETDPIFTASPAASVIDSGGGTLFLADDGTYKVVAAGNVYSIDGALTANRTMTMAGFELFFTGGNLRLQGQISVDIPSTHIPAGTTQAIDWDSGNIQTVDLESATGNVTLSFLNPKAGAVYTLKIIQGTTARDLVFPAAFKWEGGIALTSPTELNDAIDLITVIYDGVNYLASYGTNFS